MEFRKNIILLLLFYVILFITNSCRKFDSVNYQYVINDTKKFIFTSGSIWIYKADTGLLYDTVKCTETIKDSIDYIFTSYKEDRVYFIQEYYKMTLTHSIDDKKETHFFYTFFDRVNGNITNNLINGQCILFIDKKDEVVKFGGFINYKDTSININSINYLCEHNQIIANEQVVPIYNYDTDLYFAKNIGLVRKKDIVNGWNLISYNVFPINY